MDKNVGGRTFAPAELRSLAPAERAVADPAVFARVEGLGRIPFANVRRPKPLMDTGSGRASPDEVRESAGPAAHSTVLRLWPSLRVRRAWAGSHSPTCGGPSR